MDRDVVSYSISTSNHNKDGTEHVFLKLYLIPFLHQTTTVGQSFLFDKCCILFHFYIKPQLRISFPSCRVCCILFHFYIKPQLATWHPVRGNSCILFHFYIKPQPWALSKRVKKSCILFHFYIKPQLYHIELYRIFCCILFHFYIKPQPCKSANIKGFGCILFHFYIKPQLFFPNRLFLVVVSYSISTSNHNCQKCQVVLVLVVSYSISTSNHNLWRIRHYFQAHYHLNHILIFNGML